MRTPPVAVRGNAILVPARLLAKAGNQEGHGPCPAIGGQWSPLFQVVILSEAEPAVAGEAESKDPAFAWRLRESPSLLHENVGWWGSFVARHAGSSG